MPTATVVVESVPGFAGPARCYQVTPPAVFEGRSYDYVTAVVVPSFAHQNAEVKLFPALASGACATPQLRRRGGSFTLQDDYHPGDVVYEDGARWLALLMLGYQVEPQDAV